MNNYKLSNYAKSFYLAWEQNPSSDNYNLCFYYQFKNQRQVNRLIDAVKAVIKQNNYLRQTFHRKNDNIYVTLHEELPPVINYLTLDNILDKAKILQQLKKIPHDLNNLSSILLTSIYDLQNQDYFLFFNIHHILLDGVGIEAFIQLLNQKTLRNIQTNIQVQDKAFDKAGADLIAPYIQEIIKIQEDYEIPNYKTTEIYSETQWLEPNLYHQLICFANQNKLSLFNLLLNLYAIFDSKIRGKTSSLVLYPVNRRAQRPQVTLDMAINSIVFAIKINTGETLESLLKKHQKNFDLYKCLVNIDILSLIETYNIPTEISSFAMSQMAKLPNLDGAIAQVLPQMANSPYCIKYIEESGHIAIRFDCYQGIWDTEITCSFLTRFLAFCEKLINCPHVGLEQIDILFDREREQLLTTFNEKYITYPQQINLISLFDQTVTHNSNKTAIVASNGRLSYSELRKQAKSYAQQLVDTGVKAGEYVAILSSRNYDFYSMVLGVLYAQAVFIPLDNSYPYERILEILTDSQAWLLTNNIDYQTYAKRINLDPTKQLSLCQKNQVHHSNTHACCVIYTSGSTGKPKGVILSTGNIINFSLWYIKARNLSNLDNYAVHASFGFDAGAIMGVFPGLLAGSCIHVIPQDIRLDLSAIKDYFLIHNIVGCFFTTKIAEQLMKSSKGFPSLRFLECGGEKLTHYSRQKYDFYNGYGPTECTVYATQYQLIQEISNIPIGKPLTNYSCYVVSENMNLLPIGLPGELLIGGEGVGIGYLNQPELTAKKFIANPFQTEEEKVLGYNTRLYRTGDLVRRLWDGNIEYIGRLDTQVKIRGHRIELIEIQNCLLKYSEIKEAVVVIKKVNNNDTIGKLAAYYISDNNLSEHTLRQHLTKYLPDYMIPNYFWKIETIPLKAANGKLDEDKLPIPFNNKLQNKKITNSAIEQLVCKGFASVLGIDIEQIGIEDDFFEIGGDSLSTIALAIELQENFDISVTDIFKFRTPQTIARETKLIKDYLRLHLLKIKLQFQNNTKYDFQNIIKKNKFYQKYLSTYKSYDFTMQTKRINNILLTGATGYLGCHLLFQLLHTTKYDIYLLVRGNSDQHAFERVTGEYAYYFNEDLTRFSDRITTFSSCLEHKNLALNDDKYTKLIKEIDSIIHPAALIKHYGTYSEFYQANVQATINLLELCMLTDMKDFHYISTYGIFFDNALKNHDCNGIFNEDSDTSNLNLDNYYNKTKYLSELEVIKYRNYGMVSNIYRIGNLAVNSDNYFSPKNIAENRFAHLIKTFVNLGMVPEEFSEVEISPVNTTALGIVKIFNKIDLSNQIYHVFSPYRFNLTGLINGRQYIKITSMDEFIDKILSLLAIGLDSDQNLKKFLLHQGWLDNNYKYTDTHVDCSKTQLILNKMGVLWSSNITLIENFIKDK